MRDYVHLHRKALASWVFEDLRRWHLFSFLLLKADEKGRVEVSVNSYCATYHIPRTTVLRLLEEMGERGILGQKTDNKRTTITLCKYENYNTSTTKMWTTNGQQTDNPAPSKEEKDEERENERERDVPPTPPSYKEKEKEKEVEREETPLLVVKNAREDVFSETEKAKGDIDTSRLDAEITALASSQQRMELLAMREHLTLEEVRARLTGFRLECMVQGTLSHSNLEDTFRHFGNWLRVRLEKERKGYGANKQFSYEDRSEAARRRRMERYAAVAAEFYHQADNPGLRQPGTVPPDVPF